MKRNDAKQKDVSDFHIGFRIWKRWEYGKREELVCLVNLRNAWPNWSDTASTKKWQLVDLFQYKDCVSPFPPFIAESLCRLKLIGKICSASLLAKWNHIADKSIYSQKSNGSDDWIRWLGIAGLCSGSTNLNYFIRLNHFIKLKKVYWIEPKGIKTTKR